ncbi:MAG TPA: 5-formyltetrahydrofolate cyclo-ligase [Candidatus Rubneribacter avistercoris]|nr:5-formyltetrahydrofolate cyclo-ligase [Candidatus Rubneribacter avistercoris]
MAKGAGDGVGRGAAHKAWKARPSNDARDAVSLGKDRLRSLVLARRDAIAAAERAMRSRLLCARLVELLSPRLGPGAVVAAYAALGSEPDLGAFVEEAYLRGWRVCLPCMIRVPESAREPVGAGRRARMAFLDVGRDAFEAREAPFLAHPARSVPADCPSIAGFAEVAPEVIDAVAVPLVAFDDMGNRLGYGGGNYDRFLAKARHDAWVAGIAFTEQRVDAVPVEPHDRPLPHIESV